MLCVCCTVNAKYDSLCSRSREKLNRGIIKKSRRRRPGRKSRKGFAVLFRKRPPRGQRKNDCSRQFYRPRHPRSYDTRVYYGGRPEPERVATDATAQTTCPTRKSPSTFRTFSRCFPYRASGATSRRCVPKRISGTYARPCSTKSRPRRPSSGGYVTARPSTVDPWQRVRNVRRNVFVFYRFRLSRRSENPTRAPTNMKAPLTTKPQNNVAAEQIYISLDTASRRHERR